MSTISESNNQVNFNPAWMQSVRPDKPNLRSSVDSEENNRMESVPVFAIHRYGREDILALIPQSTRPPDGLSASQFFVETPLEPIIFTPLNETEQRCQQNINSSKALSLVNHTATRNGTGATAALQSSPWSVAGGAKQKTTPTVNSRWKHLVSSDSPSAGYVKPGTGRSGAAGGMGRGGGVAGSGSSRTIVRNPPEGKSGFNATSRTRYKSTSEDGSQNIVNNGWTVVGGKSNLHESSEHAWRSGRGESEQPLTFDRFDASDLNASFSQSNSNRAAMAPVNPMASQIIRDSRGDTSTARFDDAASTITTNNWDPLGTKNLIEHHSPPLTFANPGPYAAYLRQPSNLSTAPEVQTQDLDISNLANHLDSVSLSAGSNEYWCYLDPNGSQHGPYESVQMLIWYKSGFFRNDLRCRKAQTESFVTLGELVRKNGNGNPFVFPVAAPQAPLGYSNSGSRSPWTNTNAEAQKILESQKALQEERRRLEEQQERLRREEQERIDKERALLELEGELQRRQAELNRLATVREQELEQKRREIADFERMQRIETENRLLEKRRAEELEVRRQQEEIERNRQLLEEQQRRAAEELRLKQEAAAAEAERLREQAMIEARQVALEAERKLQQQKAAQAEAERKAAEEKRAEHARQLVEAQRRRKAEEAARAAEQARIAAAKAAAINAAKVAPWSATSAKKVNPQLQSQRSLLEIQLEEERILEEARKREIEALEHQKKIPSNKAAKPWAASAVVGATKTPWNEASSRDLPVTKSPTAPANNSSWPPIPSASPQFAKNIEPKVAPKAPTVVSQQPSQKNKKAPEKEGVNVFQKWLVDAIKRLNKIVGTTVDADTFSIFIETVDNPDEVEDYCLSYFGETEAVKDFHQEFLEKRIRLRPRSKVSSKDDLSAAQSAVNAAKITSDFQTVKKKGKGKGKGPVKTVDLTVLSFKPSSDPNRINVGEIDTAPPMASKKKR